MAEPVVVIGVGMVTAVGLSAPETAASVRAATMRFVETSIRDHRFEPFTLAEVIEEGLPPVEEGAATRPGMTSRELRMLRLASAPLAECLASLPETAPRAGLILALPETATTIPLEPGAFLRSLHTQVNGTFDLARSEATEVGRAGGLKAIQRAARLLQAGQTKVVIAGGIDTYRDLYVLGTLDMEKRVKSAVHLDGFVPGEGAGFLLLATATAASGLGVDPLARLSSCVVGSEVGHLYSEQPYTGDGLAATVQELVRTGEVAVPIREVYASMNGEHHWAKEWGVTFIRNQAAFDADHGMHHPADCFGDTGAACGPLMVGLAALGVSRGHRRSPALVYCSSDRGERAALAVQTV